MRERLEEIKQIVDEYWINADNARGQEAHLSGEVFALCDHVEHLLKKLEEAQQTIELLKKKMELIKNSSESYSRANQIAHETLRGMNVEQIYADKERT